MDITVKVKIGDVEVELTLEEATELHAVLGRICGKPDPVVVSAPCVVYVPFHEPRPYWQWPLYTVTCNTNGITLHVAEAGGTSIGSSTFSNSTFSLQ